MDAPNAERPVEAVDDEHDVDVGGDDLLGRGGARRAPRQRRAARQDGRDGAVGHGGPVAGGQAGSADGELAALGDREAAAAVDAGDPRRHRAGDAEVGQLGRATAVPAEAGER